MFRASSLSTFATPPHEPSPAHARRHSCPPRLHPAAAQGTARSRRQTSPRWVVEAARACPQLDQVLVAADSDEVAQLCHRLGFPVQLTSPELASGPTRPCRRATGRCRRLCQHPGRRAAAATRTHRRAAAPLCTTPSSARAGRCVHLKVRCTAENIANPTPSRWSPTPTVARCTSPRRNSFHRDAADPVPQYWKHIGLYAYASALSNLFPRCRRARWNAPSAWSSSASGERIEHLRRAHRARHHRRGHGRRPANGRGPPPHTSDLAMRFHDLVQDCARRPRALLGQRGQRSSPY